MYLPTETRELSNSLHQLPWSLSPGTSAREAHVVPVNLGGQHFLKPWLTLTTGGGMGEEAGTQRRETEL